MKTTITKWIGIFIESINYMIISYALGCMTMLFKTNWLFILFTASEFWLLSKYFAALNKLTKNKIISAVVLVCSFMGTCFMMYFIGYIDGIFVPFAS